MSDKKSPQIVLNLESADDGKDRRPHGHNGSCRPHVVICPGYGDTDFPFPNAETLVVRALGRLKSKRKKSTSGGEPAEGVFSEADEGDQSNLIGVDTFAPQKSQAIIAESGDGLVGKLGPIQPPRALIPQTRSARDNGIDGTLFVAAGGLRELLEDGKYDAIVAERFDDLVDKVNWARDNMDAKYAQAVSSLSNQLAKLRQVYLAALPRVLDGLRAQNPGAPEGKLLEAAIEVLDEELTQILAVLRIWTDAFGQQRSGKYRELDAVVFAVEQAFHLFEGNDLSAPMPVDVMNRLKTRVFGVGNVFVARFSGEGPATLPGTRGPVGAHAMEVPHDERNFITLMLVLYMHEFRHDIFHDVEGLGEELTNLVAQALRDAHNGDELKLSRDQVNIGKQRVSLLNLLIKMYADTIGEVDADISGGVMLAGPAFLYNMVMTFSAFNARRKGVFNVPQLLRTSSFYEYQELPSGQATISFLPHPPDYIRAYIVAAALDEIGFAAEAKQCRLLADQAIGFKVPDYITWDAVSGDKNRPTIKIPVEDIKNAAPIVARALIRGKLKSLGGVSTGEILNWTKERQAKADMLAEMLMDGRSDLPQDKGDLPVTCVIAAASLAYWGLCKSGMQPRYAARIIEENALKMIDQVKARFEKLKEPSS
ncbi:MAG: hypothetical protein K2X70_01340 [Candidatus Obscuribacterales bacterium]|jgi:hypothetical protein|nr:hypothetical protein [Candidatus Obscuribacterales bacterium]